MIHIFKKCTLWLLMAALLTAMLPTLAAHGAYPNGYTGGMAGDGSGIYAHGVDISEWQGYHVDFERIREQGYSFVILRIGFATTMDKTFEGNYERAKAAGLDVGVYLYSYAATPEGARAEAQACLSWLEGRQLEYPVYFDLEDPEVHGNLSRQALTELAAAFMEEISDAGWLTGLYSCLSWLEHSIDTKTLCRNYECWMAQFLYSGDYSIYDRYDEVYGMWQYSCSGKVDGIPGNVDMNISFKDYPAICRQYGFNGYEALGETLYLRGAAPTAIVKTGQGFSVSGTVRSNKGSLSNVTAGIYDAMGQWVTGRSGSSKTDSFELSSLEDGIKWTQLTEGKYYYRVSASNSYESKILLSHSFYVTDSGVFLDGVSVPEDLKEGERFRPEGVLTAIEPIELLTVSIKGSDGKELCKAEAKPRTMSYDLSLLPQLPETDALPMGSYRYYIAVKTASGVYNLCREDFSVWAKDDPITLTGFSLNSEYYPGELTELCGQVTSAHSDLRLFNISVYNTENSLVTAATEQNPGRSFRLEDHQKTLALELLDIGKYRLQITAINDGGPVLLADTVFLVRNESISLCSFQPPTVLCQGDSFRLSGMVAGDTGILQYVSAQVLDANGNALLSAAALPNAMCFDLGNFRDRLLFSLLDCGEYTLRIIGETSRNFEILYDAPLTVIDSEDRIFWEGDYIMPNGMAYSQGKEFTLWGTLSSQNSEIHSVTVQICNSREECVAEAQMRPEEQKAYLASFNQSLRIAPLPADQYILKVTAENDSGTYVMLASPFLIVHCEHSNVRSGAVYGESCLYSGAVCHSRCSDCGEKVGDGFVLQKQPHSFREGSCTACGASDFIDVKAIRTEETVQQAQRYVLAVEEMGQWYALDFEGNTVPILPPDAEGNLRVSAGLLWTAHCRGRDCYFTNPFGSSLQLDSFGLSVAAGSANRWLHLSFQEEGCMLSDAASQKRFLSFRDGEFSVCENGSPLILFRFLPE